MKFLQFVIKINFCRKYVKFQVAELLCRTYYFINVKIHYSSQLNFQCKTKYLSTRKIQMLIKQGLE